LALDLEAEREEREFECLSPEQIIAKQEREVRSVADLFKISQAAASIFLRYYQWNKEKLISNYLENPEKVRKEAGVSKLTEEELTEVNKSQAVQLTGDQTCSICAEDVSSENCTALR
jgi:ariadne-1